MHTSRIFIFTMLLFLICVSVQAQTYPQVGIPNTEERALYSKIMEYEYGVYVTLPRGYKNNTDILYPTLYIIDGNQYLAETIGGFPTINEIVGHGDRYLNECIGKRWPDNFYQSIINDDRQVMVDGQVQVDKLETPFIDSDGRVIIQLKLVLIKL